ncbi:MAG: ABC transporter ATP-binding protein [Puniceicoccaceae bacterium]|nr:MAG: ABC transporter ATP-binding protein [Puniceicoccaceae bacterium]
MPAVSTRSDLPAVAASPSPDPLLEVRALHHTYNSEPVLRGIDLTLGAGERLALTGPSGSGKTTLLNCIGGIDRPRAGEVFIHGQHLGGLNPEALARFRRRHLGTVFQLFHLLPTLTVRENIELPLILTRVSGSLREARVDELLDRVGLRHRANALPGEISGGERQRAAVARAVAHRPSLLLADEPTGSLDQTNGAEILRLLAEVSRENRAALVLVTHSDEAAAICTRRLRLLDGRLTDAA